jgi:hypothetical protein
LDTGFFNFSAQDQQKALTAAADSTITAGPRWKVMRLLCTRNQEHRQQPISPITGEVFVGSRRKLSKVLCATQE